MHRGCRLSRFVVREWTRQTYVSVNVVAPASWLLRLRDTGLILSSPPSPSENQCTISLSIADDSPAAVSRPCPGRGYDGR